ncbi:MAG: ester cyclase [Rubrobacter sp.]
MFEHEAVETKKRIWGGLKQIAAAGPDEIEREALEVFAPDAGWLGSQPLNRLEGLKETVDTVWRPLKESFPDLERRDDIFMGGRFDGADWICATGYYFGSFERDWLGIPATRGWAYLRYGEFYRLDGGRVAGSYVILDVLDLMRQAGVFPWRPGLGVETLVPGPATHDGVVLRDQDPAESEKSLQLVEDMLFIGLVQEGRENMGMEGYWTPDMMWYGPGLIGTTRGIEGFFDLHQEPWAASIPDSDGGNHVSRFADGNYVASTGWPSIYATHTGDFYDIPPTGKPLEIRVMDWWRRDGDLLAENWIFIDFPHTFLQLDIDLFERMAELRDARRESTG